MDVEPSWEPPNKTKAPPTSVLNSKQTLIASCVSNILICIDALPEAVVQGKYTKEEATFVLSFYQKLIASYKNINLA